MTSGDFHVEVQEGGAVVRASLEGKLDAATVPVFLDTVQPLVATARQVVLDCTRLEFCDSSGLRGIVVVRNELGGAGGVTLTGASDGLRQILEITGLTDLLAEVDQS